MPRIEYIKNLSIISKDNNFSHVINSVVDNSPHEFIIRQITYQSKAPMSEIYLLWCSLSNSYICSLPIFNIAPHTTAGTTDGYIGGSNIYPNRSLLIQEPLNKTVEFKVHRIDLNGKLYDDADGLIIILADIYKYKQ